MPTNQQWLPSSIQVQMLEQQKKQAMAQALLGSMQTAQPQMVGGRYISPGIGGAITNVAKALMGGKLQQDQLQSQADIMKGMAGKWDMGSPESLIKAGMTPKSVKQYVENGDGTQLQKQPKEPGYSDFRYVDGGKTDVDPATGLKRVEVLYADGTRGMKPIPGGQTIRIGNDPFTQAASKEQTASMAELTKEAQKGKRALNTLGKAAALLKDGNMYTGTGAKFMDFANGLGHTLFGIDRSKVDSDQKYQSLMIRNLESLVRDIGGTNISNTDLENAFKAGGVDTAQGIAALKAIVTELQRAANAKIGAFNAAADAFQGDPGYWRAIVNGTSEGLAMPIEGENGQDSAPVPTKAELDAVHTNVTDSLRKLRSMGNQ